MIAIASPLKNPTSSKISIDALRSAAGKRRSAAVEMQRGKKQAA